MTYFELLDAVKILSRQEKVYLLKTIEEDLGEVTPDEVLLAKCFPPGATLNFREPFFAPEAALILKRMLEEQQKA